MLPFRLLIKLTLMMMMVRRRYELCIVMVPRDEMGSNLIDSGYKEILLCLVEELVYERMG